MLNQINIRNVCDKDMPAIQAIYALEVAEGVSSWEELPPSVSQMKQRQEAITQDGYPYIVAVLGDQVLGYAYASAYRTRPAYRYTVENSIYLAASAQRMGLGQKLLSQLIIQCTQKAFAK